MAINEGTNQRTSAVVDWSEAERSEAEAVQMLEQAQWHLAEGSKVQPVEALYVKLELEKFVSKRSGTGTPEVPEPNPFLLTEKKNGKIIVDELLQTLTDSPVSLDGVKKSLENLKRSSGTIFGLEGLKRHLFRTFSKSECRVLMERMPPRYPWARLRRLGRSCENLDAGAD